MHTSTLSSALSGYVVVCLALVARSVLWSVVTVPAPPPPAVTSTADALVQRPTLERCLSAADLYEEAAATSTACPLRARYELQAAEALACAMRIQSSGFVALVERELGNSDSTSWWSAHGARALRLVRSARAEGSLAAEAARVEADAELLINGGERWQRYAQGCVASAQDSLRRTVLRCASAISLRRTFPGASADDDLGELDRL